MKTDFRYSFNRSQQRLQSFLRAIRKIEFWWQGMAILCAAGCSKFITAREYNFILKCAGESDISLEPEVIPLAGGSCESWEVRLPGEPPQKCSSGLGRRVLCICDEWFRSSRVMLERRCRHTDAVYEFERHLVGENPRQLKLF